jgi:hypothetical protein
MKTFTAVVERDPVTGLLVGYVPGFPGAHSEADTLDELNNPNGVVSPGGLRKCRNPVGVGDSFLAHPG